MPSNLLFHVVRRNALLVSVPPSHHRHHRESLGTRSHTALGMSAYSGLLDMAVSFYNPVLQYFAGFLAHLALTAALSVLRSNESSKEAIHTSCVCMLDSRDSHSYCRVPCSSPHQKGRQRGCPLLLRVPV